MSEFTNNSIETEDPGWPGPVTVHVRPTKPWWQWPRVVLTEPWWKSRRTILIAAIGCLIGSIFWASRGYACWPRFWVAVYLCAPKLARWLPRASARASQWFHERYLGLYRRRWLQFRLRELFVLVLFCGVALTGLELDQSYRKARANKMRLSRRSKPWAAASYRLPTARPGFPCSTGHYVSFNGQPLRDKDLAYLSTFPAAKSVFPAT